MALAFAVTLLLFLIQVFVCGYIIRSVCYPEIKNSLVDAFTTGFVVNSIGYFVLVSCGITIEYASWILRAAIGLFIIYGGIRIWRITHNIGVSSNSSHCYFKLFLGLTVAIFATTSMLSHSLGFDDVVHLDYLLSVRSGNPYPTFRPLFGNWMAVRYPLFGLFVGGLGIGISGSGLVLYYLFGVTLVSAFCVKVFEICLSHQIPARLAVTYTSLIVSLLLVAGIDSYMNFGAYPLQEAKLIMMLGAIYLLPGWILLNRSDYFWPGVGLVIVGSLWHFNAAPIAIVYTAVIVAILLLVKRGPGFLRKLWLMAGLVVAIAALTLYAPEPSIKKDDAGVITQAIPPITTENPQRDTVNHVSTLGSSSNPVPASPSLIQSTLSAVKEILASRYYARAWTIRDYLVRIGFLPFLLPLLIAGMTRLQTLRLANPLLAVTLLVISYQLLASVPRQVVGSMVRSGTAWMLLDLSRHNLQKNKIVITDPYTGLYLKHIGNENVESPTTLDQLRLFSALFPMQIGLNTAQRIANTDEVVFLLNTRYWYPQAADRWTGNLDNESWDALWNDLIATGPYRGTESIERLARYGANIFRYLSQQQLHSIDIGEFKSLALQSSIQPFKAGFSIFRDIAIIPLGPISENSWIDLNVRGEGYAVELLSIIDKSFEELVEPLFDGNHTFFVARTTGGEPRQPIIWLEEHEYVRDEARIRIRVPVTRRDAFALIRFSGGPYSGLGQISDVQLEKARCKMLSQPIKNKVTCEDQVVFNYHGP